MSADLLLGGDDPPVFRIEGPGARSPFVIACDHGGRQIPLRLGNLGLSEETLSAHVAWDIGVARLGRRLAARLDAFLIVNNYSRLVVDANRPPGAHDSIVTLSEHTRVAANEGLDESEVRRRLDELFHPYHARIRRELDDRAARDLPTVLIALHSFTPVFKGNARRWHAGVLYGRDARMAHRVLAALRSDLALDVGDNEPYAVSDATDYTVVEHGEKRGIPHIELEIRQDLLTDDVEVEAWSERLAPVLEDAAKHVLSS